MSQFDEATRVAADGTAEIAVGWDIGGNANGGYLLALVASHMRAVAGRVDPLTVTGHYLAPGPAGPVHVAAEVVKSGKRLATVTGSIEQDGRRMLQAIGTFGDLAATVGGFERLTATPPDLPPIEQCVRRPVDQGAVPIPMMQRLDVRLRPQDVGFDQGRPSGSAEMAGWFSFADGRPIDTLALLLVCDALPPAAFNAEIPAGWVPTVEYTVHVRGVPAPGPVACAFRTRVITGGYLEEDGEVWDLSGRLVAMSRQLALVPR